MGVAIFLEGASSVTIGNYTIITGGYNLNPKTNEVEASKSMNLVNYVKDGFLKGFKVDHVGKIVQQRYFHSTFYNKQSKKVFIMGGIEIKPSGELKWVSSVEYMNFDLGNKDKSKYSWVTDKVGPIKQARSNFNGFSSNEFIYLYGGVNGIETHENSMERYNCVKLVAESINFQKPNGFQYPASGLCLENKADEFFIIGGANDKKKISNEVHIVNVESKKITLHSKMNLPRSWSGGLKLENPSGLIVFGGDSGEAGLNCEFFDFSNNQKKEWTLKKLPDCLNYNLSEGEEKVTAESLSYLTHGAFNYLNQNVDTY